MTRETPAGWYPDPGQTADGPATERWWDGRAWTAHIRPKERPGADAPPAPPPSESDTAPHPAAPPHAEEPGDAAQGRDTAASGGAAAPSGAGAAGGAGAPGHAGAPGGEAEPGPAGAPGSAGQPSGAGAPDRTRAPGPAGAAEPISATEFPSAASTSTAADAPPAGAAPGHEAGASPFAREAAAAPTPRYGTGSGHPAPFGPPPSFGHPASPGHPAAAGYPAHPGYPAAPPSPPRGRRLRAAIAVGAAVVVLAGIGVGVYALTDDGGGGSATSQAPGGTGGPFGGPGGSGGDGGSGGSEGDGGSGGSGGSGGQSPQPDRSEPPKLRSGSVTDPVSGISLPIPKGWYGQQGQAGAQVTSEDSYKCPGDTASTCTEGGAYSAPALALGTKGDTPEEIAKADIAANAEESYGGKSYGGITSHDVLASQAVTVAGQKGYLVRWKAVTSKGADGIVESLAFPSPVNTKLMVVVRFGVDADQKESVLDEIARGIKASSGRGNGQDV